MLARVVRPGAALLLFALEACAATPPAADPPAPTAATEEPAPAESADPAAAAGDPAESAPPPASTVKRKDDSIPDDYTVSNGDCISLGKKMGALTRSDEGAKMSPKLKE